MKKTLVNYYSRKGENYFGGALKHIDKGNTEIVAEFIRDAVGADLFEVETVKEYDKSYMVCIDEAKKELRENARPALKEYLSDISEYDNIVVAGPCWWGTYPMAIFSQLDKLDLGGKKVFPVMTHEGSGLASSAKDIKKYCSDVGEGLAIQGALAESSKSAVEKWAKQNLM
ncbi:MAG: NAD(P)H-dependent oxidoreductase [Eubacterium sp.]|nr:NAD(P)H-dependent oxidoreductase [Eubacterium sp.]